MPLLDNFDRANEGPPPSASWTDPADAASLKVVTNQCVHDNTTLYSEAYYNTVFNADQECEVTLATLWNDGNPAGGMHLRAQDVTEASDKYNIDFIRVTGAANDVLRFFKKIAGVWTQLGADVALGADWVAGDIVKGQLLGSIFNVYRNGVFVATRTDSSITGSGRLALVFNANIGTPAYDNFSGGATAFPTIAGSVATNGSTAATNKVCNIGSPSNGQLVILVLRSAAADTHSLPTGWSWLVQNNVADGSDDTTSILYKVADGTEGTTVTVNGTASLKFAAVCTRITENTHDNATAPAISAIAIGSSINPDSASLSPAGGAKDFLWMSVSAYAGVATNPPTYPTNYTLGKISADSGSGGAQASNCRVNNACRQLNPATEDPGAYTVSTSQFWSAWTIAVYPVTAAQNKMRWPIAMGIGGRGGTNLRPGIIG